jgi:hypothetical protein
MRPAAESVLGDNYEARLLSDFSLWGLEDLHFVYAEIGSSNCFDSDNKRARNWQLIACSDYQTCLEEVGLKWAKYVSRGYLQPSGRRGTPEGWIKKVRALLDANDPICGRVPLSIDVVLETPTCWEDKHRVDSFLEKLSFMNIERCSVGCGNMKQIKLTLKPKTSFELWLFQAYLNRVFGYVRLTEPYIVSA